MEISIPAEPVFTRGVPHDGRCLDCGEEMLKLFSRESEGILCLSLSEPVSKPEQALSFTIHASKRIDISIRGGKVIIEVANSASGIITLFVPKAKETRPVSFFMAAVWLGVGDLRVRRSSVR